jgi:hypothetical protein
MWHSFGVSAVPWILVGSCWVGSIANYVDGSGKRKMNEYRDHLSDSHAVFADY